VGYRHTIMGFATILSHIEIKKKTPSDMCLYYITLYKIFQGVF